VTPSPQFESAIHELLERDIIKPSGLRNFSIHRVVQEATNYHNKEERQESFDIAATLVNEQFPNRRKMDNFVGRWSWCQEFVSHGVQLSKKFLQHTKSATLKGSPSLVELLSNCSWYSLSG
jgi:hypothetical protein